jgi:Bifunctional DNA primase/polymerase, N-terminal
MNMNFVAQPNNTNDLDTDLTNVTADRQTLLANGYEPLPLNGKRPHITSWSEKEITTYSVDSWARDRAHQDSINTGIRCGHVVGIDVDILDEATAAFCEQSIRGIGSDGFGVRHT